MNNFREVLQELEKRVNAGATIEEIQIHQSAPHTLYGVTIETTDGYKVWIGFPDIDQNIQVWNDTEVDDFWKI